MDLATAVATGAVVEKGAFAAMIGRDPSAISYYISKRKLTAPALVGVGRNSRVNVRLAVQQLGMSLDLGQQLAQQSSLLLTPEVPAPPIVSETHRAAEDFTPVGGAGYPPSEQSLLLRARREQAELDVERSKTKARQDDGTLVVKADVDRYMAKRLGAIVSRLEGSLPQLASQLASHLQGSSREITVLLRDWLRDQRKAIADEARDQAASRPDAVSLADGLAVLDGEA
ncbi:hypothetical protein [Nitrospirillum bahiense]|uniref:Uncharacterized protein n=1 Tax=Nitrospirillum amazonense TaxID=28077 RepID=A0A560F1Y7_9PROT|nr:hypothetical protein [Nitrospirillum amazonense]TWB15607.1 hypothetical protein FBZ88_12960 [Nitrospirillum amazonense]